MGRMICLLLRKEGRCCSVSLNDISSKEVTFGFGSHIEFVYNTYNKILGLLLIGNHTTFQSLDFRLLRPVNGNVKTMIELALVV